LKTLRGYFGELCSNKIPTKCTGHVMTKIPARRTNTKISSSFARAIFVRAPGESKIDLLSSGFEGRSDVSLRTSEPGSRTLSRFGA